jgi:uncharacterized protein YecE (DUF72 family)
MTFYRIPTVEVVTKWAKTTPDDFVFAAKFPQTVTHEGTMDSRLQDARAFIEVMTSMGGKLGPLLLQFPYGFKPDQEPVLLKLIDAMPDNIKVSIELRNRKWLDTSLIFDRMRERNMALCLIDHPWMPRLTMRTADFVYMRFLGDRKKIEDDFSYVRNDRDEDLDWWKTLINEVAAEKRDLYAYFNNHYSGHAPSTAWLLMEKLGLTPPS